MVYLIPLALGVAEYFVSGWAAVVLLMWTISRHHDPDKAAHDVISFIAGYFITALLHLPQLPL